MPNWNHEEKEPKHVKVFSAIDADQDLTSAANAGEMAGYCARWITVCGAGILVVKDQHGNTVPLPAAPAGHRWFGQWSAIVYSGTTATRLVVKW